MTMLDNREMLLLKEDTERTFKYIQTLTSTMKRLKAGDLPFSRAIIHNDIIEVSGQVGLKDGKLQDTLEEQTKQTLQNIKDILKEAGSDMDSIIKARIYLTDMQDYDKVNEIYKTFFNEFPTRVAIGVKALPLGAKIEIECTAKSNL